MTSSIVPIWRPQRGQDLHHEVEILASAGDIARGACIAIVESFGYGWYANAMPPLSDGTSSMVPGMIRRGNCGEDVVRAKAWCERIAGLHPEEPGDRSFESVGQAKPRGATNDVRRGTRPTAISFATSHAASERVSSDERSASQAGKGPRLKFTSP